MVADGPPATALRFNAPDPDIRQVCWVVWGLHLSLMLRGPGAQSSGQQGEAWFACDVSTAALVDMQPSLGSRLLQPACFFHSLCACCACLPLQKPPRDPDEQLITPWVFVRYMVVGAYVGCATVGVFVTWYLCDSFFGIDLSQVRFVGKGGEVWGASLLPTMWALLCLRAAVPPTLSLQIKCWRTIQLQRSTGCACGRSLDCCWRFSLCLSHTGWSHHSELASAVSLGGLPQMG